MVENSSIIRHIEELKDWRVKPKVVREAEEASAMNEWTA